MPREESESTTTLVSALDVCVCFWAMRPVKSSSKKRMDWPSVWRCRRQIVIGLRPGPTASEVIALWPSCVIGLPSTTIKRMPTSHGHSCAKSASGPAALARSTRPPMR